MPHEILEREEIVNKTTYNSRDPLATVFYAVEGILEFANITWTSYNQLQAVNIDYASVHRTGKFDLDIFEWNFM